MLKKLFSQATNDRIHWTTLISEKILLALIGIATCIAAALYLWEML